MPTSRFVPFIDAIQYDGTNGAEVLALVPGWRTDDEGGVILPYIFSEIGGTLIMKLVTSYENTTYTVTMVTGDWMRVPVAGYSLDSVQTYTAASPISGQFIPDPS